MTPEIVYQKEIEICGHIHNSPEAEECAMHILLAIWDKCCFLGLMSLYESLTNV